MITNPKQESEISMLTEYQVKERVQFIQALRELADWYDEHQDLRAPTTSVQFNLMCHDKEDLLAMRRAAGLRDKVYSGDYISFRKVLPGPCSYLDIYLYREKVCKKVVTGTRVVPAQPEREVEEYTWECDDALLAPDVEIITHEE